jgi:hypothetical protein
MKKKWGEARRFLLDFSIPAAYSIAMIRTGCGRARGAEI